MTPQEVTAHILERAPLSFSRASGPGGQHRDHTESRAELIVARSALAGLPHDVAVMVRRGLGLDRRPLRLASQRDRSRERNRRIVEATLLERVTVAMTPRRSRVATRPSRASVARRLDQKAHRGQTKSLRRRVDPD